MTDFFGYDVTMVMNITDVDDKIIMRANEVGGRTGAPVDTRDWCRIYLPMMHSS